MSFKDDLFHAAIQNERLDVALLDAVIRMIKSRVGYQDDRLMSDWTMTSDGHYIGSHLIDIDLRITRCAQFVMQIVESSFSLNDAVVQRAGRAGQL